MKYVKMLGLTVVAAATLTALIGVSTASAGDLCSQPENPCSAANKYPVGVVVEFTGKPTESAKLVTTDEKTTLDTCTGSTIKWKITNAGSSTTTVTGSVSTLDWSGCSFPTTTTQLSNLEGHTVGSGFNGTLTSDGEFRVTINTVLFGSCVYGVTAGTSLGTATGGKPGSFTANAVVKKLTGSEAACPETAKWTAGYGQTAPSNTGIYWSPS